MFEYKLVAVYQLLINEVMIKFCDENGANQGNNYDNDDDGSDNDDNDNDDDDNDEYDSN